MCPKLQQLYRWKYFLSPRCSAFYLLWLCYSKLALVSFFILNATLQYFYVNDNMMSKITINTRQGILLTQGKVRLYGNMYYAQGVFENPRNFSNFFHLVLLALRFVW
jgi:hypothetical protein